MALNAYITRFKETLETRKRHREERKRQWEQTIRNILSSNPLENSQASAMMSTIMAGDNLNLANLQQIEGLVAPYKAEIESQAIIHNSELKKQGLNFGGFLTILQIGALCADGSLIERLLWPERYYNNLANGMTMLKLALLTPSGGPILSLVVASLARINKATRVPKDTEDGAAVETDSSHVLLGTAYFPKYKYDRKYYCRTGDRADDLGEDVGNGFLLTVLSLVKQPRITPSGSLLKGSSTGNKKSKPFHYMRLRTVSDIKECDNHVIRINENRGNLSNNFNRIINMIASEFLAIAFLIFGYITCTFHITYLSLVQAMLSSLLVKMTMLNHSIRRQPLINTVGTSEEEKQSYMYEVADAKRGFTLIEGEDAIVRQFFRNYGHPIPKEDERHPGDLATMLGNIPIVHICFTMVILYANNGYTAIWMAYQAAVCFSWFFGQYFSVATIGRTEEAIAGALSAGKKVLLLGDDSQSGAEISLETTTVKKSAEARAMIHNAIKLFNWDLSDRSKGDFIKSIRSIDYIGHFSKQTKVGASESKVLDEKIAPQVEKAHEIKEALSHIIKEVSDSVIDDVADIAGAITGGAIEAATDNTAKDDVDEADDWDMVSVSE
ncbi:hypothetical protein EJ08DRAFT_278234 [Tothia fuscella]|uniref:Uncharacterized protein n=1 Tax=Tothia fuscella TaxID=1048955 RepID=A0A9P4TWM3_9PEZI|nr:hypothetical protein EJ08DRAFT_278234 [Tothia fuscella]